MSLIESINTNQIAAAAIPDSQQPEQAVQFREALGQPGPRPAGLSEPGLIAQLQDTGEAAPEPDLLERLRQHTTPEKTAAFIDSLSPEHRRAYEAAPPFYKLIFELGEPADTVDPYFIELMKSFAGNNGTEMSKEIAAHFFTDRFTFFVLEDRVFDEIVKNPRIGDVQAFNYKGDIFFRKSLYGTQATIELAMHEGSEIVRSLNGEPIWTFPNEQAWELRSSRDTMEFLQKNKITPVLHGKTAAEEERRVKTRYSARDWQTGVADITKFIIGRINNIEQFSAADQRKLTRDISYVTSKQLAQARWLFDAEAGVLTVKEPRGFLTIQETNLPAGQYHVLDRDVPLQAPVKAQPISSVADSSSAKKVAATEHKPGDVHLFSRVEFKFDPMLPELGWFFTWNAGIRDGEGQILAEGNPLESLFSGETTVRQGEKAHDIISHVVMANAVSLAPKDKTALPGTGVLSEFMNSAAHAALDSWEASNNIRAENSLELMELLRETSRVTLVTGDNKVLAPNTDLNEVNKADYEALIGVVQIKPANYPSGPSAQSTLIVENALLESLNELFNQHPEVARELSNNRSAVAEKYLELTQLSDKLLAEISAAEGNAETILEISQRAEYQPDAIELEFSPATSRLLMQAYQSGLQAALDQLQGTPSAQVIQAQIDLYGQALSFESGAKSQVDIQMQQQLQQQQRQQQFGGAIPQQQQQAQMGPVDDRPVYERALDTVSTENMQVSRVFINTDKVVENESLAGSFDYLGPYEEDSSVGLAIASEKALQTRLENKSLLEKAGVSPAEHGADVHAYKPLDQNNGVSIYAIALNNVPGATLMSDLNSGKPFSDEDINFIRDKIQFLNSRLISTGLQNGVNEFHLDNILVERDSKGKVVDAHLIDLALTQLRAEEVDFSELEGFIFLENNVIQGLYPQTSDQRDYAQLFSDLANHLSIGAHQYGTGSSSAEEFVTLLEQVSVYIPQLSESVNIPLRKVVSLAVQASGINVNELQRLAPEKRELLGLTDIMTGEDGQALPQSDTALYDQSGNVMSISDAERRIQGISLQPAGGDTVTVANIYRDFSERMGQQGADGIRSPADFLMFVDRLFDGMEISSTNPPVNREQLYQILVNPEGSLMQQVFRTQARGILATHGDRPEFRDASVMQEALVQHNTAVQQAAQQIIDAIPDVQGRREDGENAVALLDIDGTLIAELGLHSLDLSDAGRMPVSEQMLADALSREHQNPLAFQAMQAAVQALNDAGIPYYFVTARLPAEEAKVLEMMKQLGFTGEHFQGIKFNNGQLDKVALREQLAEEADAVFAISVGNKDQDLIQPAELETHRYTVNIRVANVGEAPDGSGAQMVSENQSPADNTQTDPGNSGDPITDSLSFESSPFTVTENEGLSEELAQQWSTDAESTVPTTFGNTENQHGYTRIDLLGQSNKKKPGFGALGGPQIDIGQLIKPAESPPVPGEMMPGVEPPTEKPVIDREAQQPIINRPGEAPLGVPLITQPENTPGHTQPSASPLDTGVKPFGIESPEAPKVSPEIQHTGRINEQIDVAQTRAYQQLPAAVKAQITLTEYQSLDMTKIDPQVLAADMNGYLQLHPKVKTDDNGQPRFRMIDYLNYDPGIQDQLALNSARFGAYDAKVQSLQQVAQINAQLANELKGITAQTNQTTAAIQRDTARKQQQSRVSVEQINLNRTQQHIPRPGQRGGDVGSTITAIQNNIVSKPPISGTVSAGTRLSSETPAPGYISLNGLTGPALNDPNYRGANSLPPYVYAKDQNGELALHVVLTQKNTVRLQPISTELIPVKAGTAETIYNGGWQSVPQLDYAQQQLLNTMHGTPIIKAAPLNVPTKGKVNNPQLPNPIPPINNPTSGSAPVPVKVPAVPVP